MSCYFLILLENINTFARLLKMGHSQNGEIGNNEDLDEM